MKSIPYACLSTLALFAVQGEAVNGLPERQLKAAQPKAHLAARSNDIPLRQKFGLHYVDDHEWNPEAMGAQLELKSNAHTLLLEEIEHLVEEVHCTSDADLHIRFIPEHFPAARDLIGRTPDLFLITSHAGCNQPGTRMPYKAIDRTFNEKESTVNFALGEACWKKDFGMKVRFGPADRKAYAFNSHDHLAPRDQGLDERAVSVVPPPAETSVAVSSAPALTAATTSSIDTSTTDLQFPTPTQSADPSVTSVTDSVAFSLQNAQIFPPLLENTTVVGTLLGVGYKVNCTDCHTTGNVSLVSGYFDTNPSNDTGNNNSSSFSNATNALEDGTEEAVDFLGDGFVEIAATGLGAHMAFQVTWLAGTGQSVQLSLGQIPLTPFAIPGVASVGASFIPNVIFSADIGSTTTFTYGFEVKVPDNSTAIASFSTSNSSRITGFGNSSVKALPFNTDAKSPNLTLTATLKPEILLGIDILNQKTGAGVFLNLPKVSVRVSQVSGTNDRCENVTQGSLNNTAQVGKLLGNLTHIEPNVNLAAGFDIEAASLGARAFTPFATNFPLPTDCLAYHAGSKSYGPATAAFASATVSTTSNAASPGRLSMSDESPIDAMARWQWMVVLLGLVCGGFIVL